MRIVGAKSSTNSGAGIRGQIPTRDQAKLAAPAAARIERFLRAHPASELTAPLLLLLVRAQLDRADADAATAAAAELRELAAAKPSGLLAALADHATGLAAGQDPEAARLLELALEAFGRLGLPLEEARARLDLAGALAAARPSMALAETRAALERFQALGATRDADAATSLLRRLGVRGHTGPRGTGKLTAREQEILGLLGQGLTNADIAARLFVSRRTVEHHVSNILAKLGLATRGEATAYVARRPVER